MRYDRKNKLLVIFIKYADNGRIGRLLTEFLKFVGVNKTKIRTNRQIL